MRHIFLYSIILGMGWGISYTQPNLILNPSVEDTDTCPDGGTGNFYYIQDWFTSNSASPDYFNICNTSSMISVPQNIFGFQYPKDGDAYFGLLFINITGVYREGVQGKFSEKLQKGRKYCFEFHTARANLYAYAIEEFGIHLSKDTIYSTFPSNNISLNPYFPVKIDYLDDTLNWTKFSIEINNYEDDIQYFVFSNFQSNNNFTLQHIDSNAPNQNTATYYYFDDFALYDCGEADTLPPEPPVPPEPVDSAIIRFPSVFTPNGDGINDVLHMEGLPPGSNLEVYNRWGDIVHKAYPYTEPWDGNKNGHPCPEGVYHYIVQMPDGQTVRKFVHLFR